MTKTFYVVYSVRSKLGSGFGRNTLICDRDIDTMDRIDQVESELLKAVQEIEPDAGYSHLFLVNWRELSSAVTNGDRGG